MDNALSPELMMTDALCIEPYDLGLDEEQAETDWQVLALDRFGDRSVNGD